jgi:hypothetical protein
VARGTGSENPDAPGTLYDITDFAAAAGEVAAAFTLSKSSAGDISAGDGFEIYPPLGFCAGALDEGRQSLTLSAAGALSLQVVGRDPDRGLLLTAAKQHQFC